jgi:hypothetical protein
MVARAVGGAVGAFSTGWLGVGDLGVAAGLAGDAGVPSVSNSMAGVFCGDAGLLGVIGVVTDVLVVDFAAGLARAATVVAAGGFFAMATFLASGVRATTVFLALVAFTDGFFMAILRSLH